jgi:hypothetical protein
MGADVLLKKIYVDNPAGLRYFDVHHFRRRGTSTIQALIEVSFQPHLKRVSNQSKGGKYEKKVE